MNTLIIIFSGILLGILAIFYIWNRFQEGLDSEEHLVKTVSRFLFQIFLVSALLTFYFFSFFIENSSPKNVPQPIQSSMEESSTYRYFNNANDELSADELKRSAEENRDENLKKVQRNNFDEEYQEADEYLKQAIERSKNK